MVTTPSVWTNSLNDVCSCVVLQGLRTFTPCDRTQPLDMVAVGMKVMVTLRNPKANGCTKVTKRKHNLFKTLR